MSTLIISNFYQTCTGDCRLDHLGSFYRSPPRISKCASLRALDNKVFASYLANSIMSSSVTWVIFLKQFISEVLCCLMLGVLST